MKYIVKQDLLHDGVYYPEGSVVDLDKRDAENLNEILEPINSSKKEKEANENK